MEYILPSGAVLVVTVSPFKDAHSLLKALMKSAQGLSVNNNILETDVSVLKDTIISAAISDDVEQALYKCFDRCSYNGQKVNVQLFDDIKLGEQARGDYFIICYRVIEANCLPFLAKTFSELKILLAKNTTDTPKPK